MFAMETIEIIVTSQLHTRNVTIKSIYDRRIYGFSFHYFLYFLKIEYKMEVVYLELSKKNASYTYFFLYRIGYTNVITFTCNYYLQKVRLITTGH